MNKKIILSVGVLVVFFGYVAYRNMQSSAPTEIPVTSGTSAGSESVNPNATTTDSGDTTVVTSGQFKDGSYSATGAYISPAGPETIKINVTLQGGVITAATVTPQAVVRESQEFQTKFTSGFKQYVIGKKITDVQLTKVSGSSLTPRGWNDAISKIEIQAQA
ncbi:MAG: calcium-binding protein [Patescibacteria group bacterium]